MAPIMNAINVPPMKLVQMPRELLHVEPDDLPALGVDTRLRAGFEAYLPRAVGDPVGLAILAPTEAGTTALLMLLARRVGAALRDANIRRRDHGEDRQAPYQRLCYLPGSALAQALEMPRARRSLDSEAACFFQDLVLAWASDAAQPDPAAFVALLDLRLTRQLPTFASADPGFLPAGLDRELRARLPVLEVGVGGDPSGPPRPRGVGEPFDPGRRPEP
jgi:hypothetical protein